MSLKNVTSVLCGEISWQFYGKKEVSIETIFNFIFYCATVSRENCMKLAAFFLIILASKMKLVDGFIILRAIKLWNRQKLIGKKMKLTARGFGGFIILCRLKFMKPSVSSIFDAKKMIKEYPPFLQQFSRETWPQ